MKILKIALPKGRMYEGIMKLLSDAGIKVDDRGRSLRPQCSDPEFEIKLLKPQNIPQLVGLGAHDMGFSGYDWILETKSDVVELLDCGLNPVRIIAAAPKTIDLQALPRRLIAVSEYETIARRYLDEKGFDYTFVRSFGATEAFPPEDADLIIDNCETGQTIKDNNLKIVDTLFDSSTRLFCNKDALKDEWKARKIRRLVTLLQSVLASRKFCMVEMNVSEENLKAVTQALPSMKSPTINSLLGGGYAVKAVIARTDVPRLVCELKDAGATDIIEYGLSKVVP